MVKLTYSALFLSTIVLANWLIGNAGTVCLDICLIPVAPGVLAPSGVLAIGLGFTLRDLLQNHAGKSWVIGSIIVGAGLSGLINPAVALASGAAFLLSEMLDFAVYTPLKDRNLLFAVLASNCVGLLVDSVVFLSLAFGSLELLLGQVIGKFEMTLVAMPVIWLINGKTLFGYQRRPLE